MAFEFLFAPQDKTAWDTLHQGDILRKSEGLVTALKEAHAFYADAPDYTHFMVLTQSCDLVIRNKKSKSRYITLAAARPLQVVVNRLVQKYQVPVKVQDLDFPIPVCQKATQVLASQRLEHLLNNTESGFFFIRKNSHPNITEDLCVFLALSVALSVKHYSACVTAKIAQLDDIFQAKVGWLTGNLYSRVGTPDIEEFEPNPDDYKKQFYQDVLYQHTAWFSPGQISNLKDLVQNWQKANPGLAITAEVARSLAAQVPDDTDLVAERAVTLLAEAKLLAAVDADTKKRAKYLISNDTAFKRLVRLIQMSEFTPPTE